MTGPLKGGISGRGYNRTLHGRSVYRPADVPGHNVVLGYSRPGVGDALDIFAPAGEPVFAMHEGVVSRIADRGGRLSCIYVAGRDATTVYAHLHIKAKLRLGTRVTEGEALGWVDRKLADPHLHLEVWLRGRALAGKTPEKLAESIAELIT